MMRVVRFHLMNFSIRLKSINILSRPSIYHDGRFCGVNWGMVDNTGLYVYTSRRVFYNVNIFGDSSAVEQLAVKLAAPRSNAWVPTE